MDEYILTNNVPPSLQNKELSEEVIIQLHTYILMKHTGSSKTNIGILYKHLNSSYSSTRPDNLYRKIEKLHQKNNQNLKKQKNKTATTTTTLVNPNPTSTTPCNSAQNTQNTVVPQPATCTSDKCSHHTTFSSSGHYGKRSVDKRDRRHKELRNQAKDIKKCLDRTIIENNEKSATIIKLSNEVANTKAKLRCANEKITNIQSLLDTILEEHHMELDKLTSDNLDLNNLVKELEEDLESNTTYGNNEDFTISTKEGTRYLNCVRELYYNLMTIGISPDKIDGTIRLVFNKLCPSIDTSSLKLPKKSCANYMRMAEMPTISDIHKATNLSSSGNGHINSDGTTLNMRKLIGSSVNGIVLGVQEVSDGTAETMLNELDKQLSKLRETATELNIPNANAINWTLIVSSTSDGASTQTKFNKLLSELRKRDEDQFGPANSEIDELIANKCGMHLGVNLRKAQISGIHEHERTLNATTDDEYALQQLDISDQATASSKREYSPLDSFVHAFCKLLGQVGTPEYGQGIKFKDYVINELTKPSASTRITYLNNVLKTNLERQVGSRYFVTACNSAKIHFLYAVALEFLIILSKVKSLNKLEQYVLDKLHDQVMIHNLKIDGLLFYHIYADLTTLVKSKKLNKSVLDMNVHYLELRSFLQEIIAYPENIFDKSTNVFISETRLQSEPSLNHKQKHDFIYNSLASMDEIQPELILPRIKVAAEHMLTKLCEYKKDQLPGGKYWNPTQQQEDVLKQLLPNNDICESILGLNDWITNNTPNLNQFTKSTLVEVKKNKTMTWLTSLTKERNCTVINTAQQKRISMEIKIREEEHVLHQKRIQKMEQEKKKAQDREQRRQTEIDKLSTVSYIDLEENLLKEIEIINNDKTRTIPGKEKKKLEILKDQIRFRNKIMNKQTKITFSTSGIPKTSDMLLDDVLHLLRMEKEEKARKRTRCDDQSNPEKRKKESAETYLSKPKDLVSLHILHKFINETSRKEELWAGKIISYNKHTKTHTLIYTGDNEEYTFDLSTDIKNGDITIVS